MKIFTTVEYLKIYSLWISYHLYISFFLFQRFTGLTRTIMDLPPSYTPGSHLDTIVVSTVYTSVLFILYQLTSMFYAIKMISYAFEKCIHFHLTILWKLKKRSFRQMIFFRFIKRLKNHICYTKYIWYD